MVNKKATEGLNQQAIEGLNKGLNKVTVAVSYLAAVTSLTESLEAKMQQLNIAGKSNVQINVV